MIHQTQGILLQTIKYSETSVIAKIYTRKFGLLSFMINGIRSTKSKGKAALLQPPNMLDMIIYYQDHKNLQRIKEFKCDYVFTSLPYDTVKGMVSLFLLEVITKCIREEETNDELYDFISLSIQFIDQCDRLDPKFHISFLLKLSGYLGFLPSEPTHENQGMFDLQNGTFIVHEPNHPYLVKGKSSKHLQQIMKIAYEALPEYSMNKMERKILLDNVILYFQLHIAGFGQLKSPAVLEEVF